MLSLRVTAYLSWRHFKQVSWRKLKPYSGSFHSSGFLHIHKWLVQKNNTRYLSRDHGKMTLTGNKLKTQLLQIARCICRCILIPTSAAYQESLVETWFVNRQDVVKPNNHGETKQALSCCWAYQRGMYMYRYLLYPNSDKWTWYHSHIGSVTWYGRIYQDSRHGFWWANCEFGLKEGSNQP